MSMELSGKIAFVTGSGRGLGRAMAERLAELGADVAIHDISWTAPAKYGEAPDLDAVAKEIARHGGRVAAVSGNIGDKSAVAKMKQEIETRLGTVDILVNCAGGDIGASGGKPDPNDALGIPLEDIRALTENNLYGTILVCQAFVPPMVKAGSGSVINIASAAAHFGVTNGVIYAALKAAVVHYTRCLAKELQAQGVRINAVESRRDQDRAFSGDPGRRSKDDELLDKVACALRRAGRDCGCGRVPGGPEKQVHQRSGPEGRRRRDAVSGMIERRVEGNDGRRTFRRHDGDRHGRRLRDRVCGLAPVRGRRGTGNALGRRSRQA